MAACGEQGTDGFSSNHGLPYRSGCSTSLFCAVRGCQRLCSHASNAAQDGFDRPAVFSIGIENFSAAAGLGAIVPAFEQGQVTLAEGWRWGLAWVCELSQRRLHAGFEDAAGGFGGQRGLNSLRG